MALDLANEYYQMYKRTAKYNIFMPIEVYIYLIATLFQERKKEPMLLLALQILSIVWAQRTIQVVVVYVKT